MSVVVGRALVDELSEARRVVEHRLDAVRRRVRARLLLEGVAWTLGTLGALAGISLLADWVLRIGLANRIGLAALTAAAVLAVAYRKLLRPLLVPLGDMDVAVLLNRHQPGVAQRVATVLELPRLIDGPFRASPAMVHAAVRQDATLLAGTDLLAPLDDGRARRFAGLLAVVLVVPTVFSAVFPGIARLWTERWLLGSSVRWPQTTYLALIGLADDGRLIVPRGEPLALQVVARPESVRVPDQVALYYRASGGPARQATFTRFATNDFRYELPPVVEPLTLTVTGGDDVLGPVAIEPIDRPTVAKLTLLARDPGRSDAAVREFDGSEGQLLFLPRTELELHLTAREPVRAASLTSKTGSAPPLEREDTRNYAARWSLSEPLALEIQLVGAAGGLTSRPYVLSIGLLKDRAPRVAVRSSGVGPRVTPQARIPIALHATDDIALTEVALELERIGVAEKERERSPRPSGAPAAPAGDDDGAGEEPAAKTPPKATRIAVEAPDADETRELERQTEVVLASRALLPGTALRLRGLASDNCADGSQTGTSRWLTFRVVTPEELFHEILMRQRAERAKFRAALGTAKEQADTLENAISPEDVDGLVRKHQVIERQVSQVANRLDASLTEMRLNDVGSAQALELLDAQVITPMRELAGDPMPAMRRVLAQMASERSNPGPHQEKARELQSEIVATMQRILDQMAQWESFVDVVNQLRGILKAQNQMIDATEETRKQRTKSIFDE